MNNTMDEYLKDADVGLLTKNGPMQIDYISLVHNFTGGKMFKIDLRDYADNYRLVPYSGNTYGLYQIDGYSPFNPKTGALNDDYEGDSHALGTPLFLVRFNKEIYLAAKDAWEHYWTWKKNRNEKRSALEEQFGYDTKHAMHLVRLLRMGEEALTTGVLNVRRPDAEELLAIRNGSWSYDDLVAYAKEVDNRARNELYAKSVLPKKPDVHYAAKIILSYTGKSKYIKRRAVNKFFAVHAIKIRLRMAVNRGTPIN